MTVFEDGTMLPGPLDAPDMMPLVKRLAAFASMVLSAALVAGILTLALHSL